MKSLQEEIKQELKHMELLAKGDLSELIRNGKDGEALANLIFFTSPVDFVNRLNTLNEKIKQDFTKLGVAAQEYYLDFLLELSLSLHSFLPNWNLWDKKRHGDLILSDAVVKKEANNTQSLACELAVSAPMINLKIMKKWQNRSLNRLKAECASEPQVESKALVGNSIEELIKNVSYGINHSHVRRIAEMRLTGQTLTEVSNDYAAFLKFAMYLGASFVTCNPPLVDAAWVADPERWNPVVDRIIENHPQDDGEALARWVTLEIVLDNMRLLRPIFLLTDGEMGCVCLQVNPNNHGNAEFMISEAMFIYKELQDCFNGGVPNVVFKLPGTQAGLHTCQVLTQRGIGVTITVNFGLFQHLPFARAIEEGQAIFSCLVEMNGRLAYPVRDELLSKLDELIELGVDEADVREAAAWSGVAVAKKLHSLIIERGYDLSRIKILVASLREYENSGYKRLPSAFPDITEVIGAGIISIFPDIRRNFDSNPDIKLIPDQISAPIPESVLGILKHSEIFKQAYFVSNQNWIAEEDVRFQPDVDLTLVDENGTVSWKPVHNTISQFCESFDKFVDRIRERKNILNLPTETEDSL